MEEQRVVAHSKIERRLREIDNRIEELINYKDVAATRDYEFRMADAEMRGLKQEKRKLLEIQGDL